jgi:hypothetical protein
LVTMVSARLSPATPTPPAASAIPPIAASISAAPVGIAAPTTPTTSPVRAATPAKPLSAGRSGGPDLGERPHGNESENCKPADDITTRGIQDCCHMGHHCCLGLFHARPSRPHEQASLLCPGSGRAAIFAELPGPVPLANVAVGAFPERLFIRQPGSVN